MYQTWSNLQNFIEISNENIINKRYFTYNPIWWNELTLDKDNSARFLSFNWKYKKWN